MSSIIEGGQLTLECLLYRLLKKENFVDLQKSKIVNGNCKYFGGKVETVCFGCEANTG